MEEECSRGFLVQKKEKDLLKLVDETIDRPMNISLYCTLSPTVQYLLPINHFNPSLRLPFE